MPLTGTEKYQSRIFRSVFSSGHEIRNRELVASEKNPSPSRANTVRLDMDISLGARPHPGICYILEWTCRVQLCIPPRHSDHGLLSTQYAHKVRLFDSLCSCTRAQFVPVALNPLRQMIFTATLTDKRPPSPLTVMQVDHVVRLTYDYLAEAFDRGRADRASPWIVPIRRSWRRDAASSLNTDGGHEVVPP